MNSNVEDEFGHNLEAIMECNHKFKLRNPAEKMPMGF